MSKLVLQKKLKFNKCCTTDFMVCYKIKTGFYTLIKKEIKTI